MGSEMCIRDREYQQQQRMRNLIHLRQADQEIQFLYGIKKNKQGTKMMAHSTGVPEKNLKKRSIAENQELGDFVENVFGVSSDAQAPEAEKATQDLLVQRVWLGLW